MSLFSDVDCYVVSIGQVFELLLFAIEWESGDAICPCQIVDLVHVRWHLGKIYRNCRIQNTAFEDLQHGGAHRLLYLAEELECYTTQRTKILSLKCVEIVAD